MAGILRRALADQPPVARARRRPSEDVWDVAGWAIVFGIIGGRLYHVITDPELYFEQRPAPDRRAQDLGRRPGHLGRDRARHARRLDRLPPQGHLAASSSPTPPRPACVSPRRIGRWGNWFNNELYGGPTSLPWKLQIHCLDVVDRARAAGAPTGQHAGQHGAAATTSRRSCTSRCGTSRSAFVLLYLDRRLRLGRGNVMALYVMGYTLGRVWIEALRTDHANHILGLRLNVWTSDHRVRARARLVRAARRLPRRAGARPPYTGAGTAEDEHGEAGRRMPRPRSTVGKGSD